MFPVAILAGGLATRLRPVTEHVPKSLIQINGEPFLVHQLRLVRAHGITRVVLCVGHLGEMISNAVGDGAAFGLQVDYSFDGPALLGTAGAVKNAVAKLGETFFVMYGDSYLPCDYGGIARNFAASERLGLMTVFRNDGHWDTSNVEFHDGQIIAYSKQELTPRMHHIDYGLGAFRAEAFDGVPAGQPYDLADLYQDLLRRRELAAYVVPQRFYEIGSPEGLRETAKFLAAQGAMQE